MAGDTEVTLQSERKHLWILISERMKDMIQNYSKFLKVLFIYLKDKDGVHTLQYADPFFILDARAKAGPGQRWELRTHSGCARKVTGTLVIKPSPSAPQGVIS